MDKDTKIIIAAKNWAMSETKKLTDGIKDIPIVNIFDYFKTSVQQSYYDGFLRAVDLMQHRHQQTVDWVEFNELAPPFMEDVLVWVKDYHGDTPSIYATVGWRLDDYMIIDDEPWSINGIDGPIKWAYIPAPKEEAIGV